MSLITSESIISLCQYFPLSCRGCMCIFMNQCYLRVELDGSKFSVLGVFIIWLLLNMFISFCDKKKKMSLILFMWYKHVQDQLNYVNFEAIAIVGPTWYCSEISSTLDLYIKSTHIWNFSPKLSELSISAFQRLTIFQLGLY